MSALKINKNRPNKTGNPNKLFNKIYNEKGEYDYRFKEELKKKFKATDYHIQKIVKKHKNALLNKEIAALKVVTHELGHNRIKVVRERYLTR